MDKTTQSIFYVGSKRKGKFDYCTLAVKHEEPFPANPDGKIDNLSLDISSTLSIFDIDDANKSLIKSWLA